MHKSLQSTYKELPEHSKRSMAAASDDSLRQLAFDNAAQANIISTVSNGKIVMANPAACKLLGYSKKILLTKSRASIFDIKEAGFKKMLKQMTAEGHSIALVTVIKKSGRRITCEINSAVFRDEDGIEKSVTGITDLSQSILKQKNIDTKKEEIIAADIIVAKSKQKTIDTKKEKVVAANIFLAISKQKNIDIKKDKIVADNIVIAKLKQKTIDSRKEKIVESNIVLALAKAEAMMTENNEWKKYVGKNSYDVMWDWNVASGEIYVGDSIEEVFGYKVQSNTVSFTDFTATLLPGEKQAVQKKLAKVMSSGNKNWNDSYRLKRFNGSIAITESRASIIRDEEGRAIFFIGAIKDISRLQELEKKVNEQSSTRQEDSEFFLHAAKLSFDIIWDWNLLTDEVYRSEGYEELFGHTVKNNKSNIAEWRNHIHPDDKKSVEKELKSALASSASYWESAYRLIRADGTIAKIFDKASIFRHPDGKAYRMIGSMHDTSKQRVLEERLEQEIKLKEKQVADAMEEAKETERSNLGKELHDNINQLLSASKLYIDMAKQGGENSEMYLSRSSEYTLSAIEEIRKLSKGLTTDIIKDLGLCDAIENIVRDTMEVNPVKITFSLKKFIEQGMSNKFKLNAFRIVQEELNNILKHAKATKVHIDLSQNKESIILIISDNGVGFDTDKKRQGIGIDNIKSRAMSYNGSADFVSQPLQGCVLTVTFPVANALLHNN